MERNHVTKKLDPRVPIDKQKTLEMLMKLPDMAQIGIVSSLSVMLAAMPEAEKTS